MRICSRCGKNRPDSQFGIKDRSRPSSASICQTCRRDYLREYHRRYAKIRGPRNAPRPNAGGKGIRRGDRPSLRGVIASGNEE